MIVAAIAIWMIVGMLAVVVWRKRAGAGLVAAGELAVMQGKGLMLRIPLALLTASFLMQILPVETLSPAIGPQSGLLGIAIAAVIGGMMPGGPMTSFPIALVFLQGGAGEPQIVALITGWSMFALHRLLAYEAPIMGWRFAALRALASLPVPIIAGLGAEMLLPLLPQ